MFTFVDLWIAFVIGACFAGVVLIGAYNAVTRPHAENQRKRMEANEAQLRG